MNKYFPPGTRKVPFRPKIENERKLHVANELASPIYVLPAPSMHSNVLNLVISITTLGIGGRNGPPSSKAYLKNLDDIGAFISRMERSRFIGQVASGAAERDGAHAIAVQLLQDAVKVPPREAREILRRDLFKPDGVGSFIETLLNTDAISLLLVTEDLSRFALFDTGPNDSWIFRQDGVVRSKFGASLWEADPAAGFVHASRGDRLPSGSWLEPGESLTSANGKFVFIYQTDGNAVVYDVSDKTKHKPIWATNTGGSPAWRLELTDVGRVVIWSAEGREAWGDPRSKSAKATHYAGCDLIMTDDGVARVMGHNGGWGWDTIWKD